MDEFKRAYVGYEVRRPGTDYVGGLQSTRRPVGIVVERFTAPEPDFPAVSGGSYNQADVNAWSTQANLVRGLPAQIKVYWQNTQTVEHLVETEVVPNYPGGGVYRSWDREFPLFAVETAGYGDITVLTPDGESAVFDMDPIEPSGDPQTDWETHIVRAVKAYLATTRPADGDTEPAETDAVEQFENAEYENAS